VWNLIELIAEGFHNICYHAVGFFFFKCYTLIMVGCNACNENEKKVGRRERERERERESDMEVKDIERAMRCVWLSRHLFWKL
jgi:hypothetical protein